MKDDAFAAAALAQDLIRIHEIYSNFFSTLSPTAWHYAPPQREGSEWNLREVVAHLGALTVLAQNSIEAALQGKTIAFPGLDTRFQFSRFNRQQIDECLDLPPDALVANFLDALSRSVETAGKLTPHELACTVKLPIYNRPVRVDELLGIQVMHPGLMHAAQVAEPAGAPPLWTGMEPPMRRRTITRMVRALSLLYRQDLGGELEAAIAFKVDGNGGGEWHVALSPDHARSSVGGAANANLRLSFRDTDLFFRMFTGRLNLLGAVLTGRLRPRGDLRLFLRFRSLFSVDAAE